jgi:hypothetical protein
MAQPPLEATVHGTVLARPTDSGVEPELRDAA